MDAKVEGSVVEVEAATTPERGELYAALAAAQGELANPVKDGTNPHFRSQYLTLGSLLASVRPVLAKHGLAVLQYAGAQAGRVRIETVLGHKSGQSVSSTLCLPVGKQDPQGYGSAITYGRRYALAALVGVEGSVDDDGNAASTPAPRGKAAASATTDDDLPF